MDPLGFMSSVPKLRHMRYILEGYTAFIGDIPVLRRCCVLQAIP